MLVEINHPCWDILTNDINPADPISAIIFFGDIFRAAYQLGFRLDPKSLGGKIKTRVIAN